jgi:hypothetical protein
MRRTVNLLKSSVMEFGMQSLIDINFLQLLATVFLGVIGIVFTVLQARSSRRQNTLNLYEKWDSPELSEYRNVAWDVWKNLEGAKEDAVICWLGGDYFGESVDEINSRIPEVQTHAIRSLLNYFARVFEYQKLGLTDRRVTQALFKEPWLWWSGFFTLLQSRVEAHLRAKELPQSQWAAASFITTLNRVVALDSVVRRR